LVENLQIQLIRPPVAIRPGRVLVSPVHHRGFSFGGHILSNLVLQGLQGLLPAAYKEQDSLESGKALRVTVRESQ
jgi:hypothetical protein